ncbi:MAG: YhdP family protein, partial [Burkholderiales bacterium]
MSLAAALRWTKTGSLWTTRALIWSLVAATFVCATFVLSLRYWVLPNIDVYRDDIAAAVSRAANARITIGRISAQWDGMRPHLKLDDVAVYDNAGRRALELSRVDSTLAWRSLLTFAVHFHALDIHRPSLAVRRDVNGIVSIAGLEVKPQAQRSGFGDWLLQQPDVEVHDAVVSWTDELRAAPPLALSGVNLRIVNRGSRHRFGLRAVPPADLAGPIDVRGDLRGDTLELLSEWNGRLFVQLGHVDLAAWSAWINMPAEVTRGSGGLRAWLTFSHDELTEAVADLTLSNVRGRLREELPVLELDRLAGRLTWKALAGGFEFSTSRLALAAAGTTLEPTDFLLRSVAARDGVRQGELHANALNLAPLVMLADKLPIDDELRAHLHAYSPRGALRDLVVKWTGEWNAPRQYSARGRFESLAFNRVEKLPGISGLSGNIDGTEKGGTLHVTGERVKLDMPQVFAAPIDIDTLTAQIGWTRAQNRHEFRFNNVSFANADAAGTVFGSYRSAPKGRGELDLTGSLARADARGVARYLPITGFAKLRPWLERAIIAGRSNDVRFRVKGNLDDFPFGEDRRGLFHVAAKMSGGALEYHERWPRIENIEGDLQFRGRRMEFLARQGTIYGVKLGRVQGEIPDLKAIPEVLTVSGDAEGPTSDFLQFAAASPVADMIEHFADGVQAEGRGRLALKLTLPIGQPAASKVSAVYQFTGNQFVFERDVPAIEQASGRIEFTESSVRIPTVTAVLLGGPVTISASNQRDGVRVTMQGRINADNVRKAGGPVWMQDLRGSTDWRGVLTLRKRIPDLVIESNLQGVSSTLPAPFAKTAAETVPFRLERRHTGSQQDRISFAYGNIVKADFARRTDGGKTLIERGAVRLGGGEAGELDKAGVWVRGALKYLDFDEWLAFSRSGEGAGSYTLAGIDLKLAQVDFFGRRFHDLAVTAMPQGAAMQIALAGREVEGNATWRGEGKGRFTARFKKLALISVDAKPPAQVKPATAKSQELPALDIVAEQFQHGQKQLGRLELNAVHQERDWKIERLRISNPDAVLAADGVWQGWQTQPRTQLTVRMDVTDAGKALARWGMPPGIRRGTAKIE